MIMFKNINSKLQTNYKLILSVICRYTISLSINMGRYRDHKNEKIFYKSRDKLKFIRY